MWSISLTPFTHNFAKNVIDLAYTFTHNFAKNVIDLAYTFYS